MNQSFLQSAQLKNKSNILIQKLFNHCFEHLVPFEQPLVFKYNSVPYSISKILFQNRYLNIPFKYFLKTTTVCFILQNHPVVTGKIKNIIISNENIVC